LIDFFSQNTLREYPLAILSIAVVFLGLWVSNVLYDRDVPNYISRKIGHLAGGIAFLLAFFFSTSAWPILITTGFGILLLIARLVKPQIIRGVGGTGRSNKIMAEIWFPWIAVSVFLISWLWLNRPEVSVTCLLFMAWGDGVTGFVRSVVYHKAVKGWWGSLAMLCVCLVISAFFVRPYWIGVAASVVAVATEQSFGEYGIFKWGDDNWAIPVTSMITILGLMTINGLL